MVFYFFIFIELAADNRENEMGFSLKAYNNNNNNNNDVLIFGFYARYLNTLSLRL